MTAEASPLPQLHRTARESAARRVEHALAELLDAGDTLARIDSLLVETPK